MNRTQALMLSLTVSGLMLACQPQPVKPAQAPEFISRCGDGRCEGPETSQNCPDDCPVIASTENVPASGPEIQVEAGGAEANRPLLYIGLMVHLEGWEDDRDQAKFERHAQLVRDYAQLFEEYGAKLTLESKELTDGSIRWGDNVLLEMEGRGHGIGVHADIGGSLSYDCDRFAADLRKERIQLESLGVEVRHVSGNTSHCDWVTATIEAGYEFTSGTVAYNVMSLPPDARPAEYRDCSTPAKCHQVFPADLEDRLHPWRAVDGSNWLTHDPKGELVILASDGGLSCLQEEFEDGLTGGCEFDPRDLEYTVTRIEEALTLADPERINLIYFSWSLGSPLDLYLLEQWLASISPYIEQGQVAWATLPEIYNAYLAWEGSNR